MHWNEPKHDVAFFNLCAFLMFAKEEIRSILVDSRMDQGGSDSRRKHYPKGRKRTLERKRKRQGGIIKHKKPKPKRKKETSSAKNASQASKSSKAAAGKDQKNFAAPF